MHVPFTTNGGTRQHKREGILRKLLWLLYKHSLLISFCQGQNFALLKRLGNKRHTSRHTRALNCRRRDCNCAVVHQVDKVCVSPQHGIDFHRAILHLLQGDRPGNGGQDKNVDVLPSLLVGAFHKLLDALLTIEERPCRNVLTLEHNIGDDRVEIFRLLLAIVLNKAADGREALRHKRAAVQQCSGVPKGREVNRDLVPVDAPHDTDGGVVAMLGRGIAVKREVGVCQGAEAEGVALRHMVSGGKREGGRRASREDACRIVLGKHAEDVGGVRDARREDGDAVERLCGGDEAGRGDEAARGLEADDGVHSGGHAAGAGRVGAEREGGQRGRDGDGGAGGRAARDVRRGARVGGRRVRRARAGQAGRELVHVDLAQAHGAGAAQQGGGEGGLRRGVGEGGARGRGRVRREVEVVLEDVRDAV